MSEDLIYIYKVIRRVLNIILIIIGIYIGTKMAVFYMPFIIAFIISLMTEPAIKYLMKKTNLSRKMSSIIIFAIVFSIIVGAITWGIVSLISESTNLLQTLNLYIDKAYTQIQTVIGKMNISKLSISNNFSGLMQNASKEILFKVSSWLTEVLTKLINGITSIPTIAIYVVITILSLCFLSLMFLNLLANVFQKV